MTRYYYTDPRAAAYMSREFKMPISAPVRDVIGNGLKQSSRPIPDWVWGRIIENEAKAITADEKYYVMPDGERMLHAWVGDLLLIRVSYYLCETSNGTVVYQRIGEKKLIVPSEWPDIDKVITRNDKPFHWPESEAA